MKEIKLTAPSAVGIDGAAPDGNKKYVLNPTVAIPEFTIRIVCDSPSVPDPLDVIVVKPVAVIL